MQHTSGVGADPRPFSQAGSLSPDTQCEPVGYSSKPGENPVGFHAARAEEAGSLPASMLPSVYIFMWN